MTLIRDLIDIPERVHQGDFVLKLSEGVGNAERTLADYVVTPQLVRCFEDALAFVRQAVEGRSSRAAYLHGSFGSGKSHFMAVLNLLLAGHPAARSRAELADVVARGNAWTQDRRFLLVPYHMIGARDMESAILGQYAETVRRLHPDAPVPGFYRAEGLFEDAKRLRAQIGDDRFFAGLNDGAAGAADDGWGDLGAGWQADAFEGAMLEPPGGDERARLVGALIGTYFSAYTQVADGRGESFVNLDDGLSILSRHAKSLGYDAVILFLDELILWLASRAADMSFVASEGTKLVKLVEAGNADRPIPLVSFVARQRDLRELVGENLAGSLQLQFADVLRHWEARFHVITLEDRNLPAIIEKRVLRPRSEAARQELAAAFEEFQGTRREVLETLLTTQGDREMFRKVYPFSPALVTTLIAVSSALQRERTALKLMLQLLVDRRDDLALGQVIPVGDLWDVIANGDEPFSDAMRIHFDNARRLYAQKLLPLLERHHGTSWDDIGQGLADPAKAGALRNDARLVKTLLLAALVPEVESLKALTASRLTALNHGSFRSPIPGREVQTVLNRCRAWAAEVGEIKIGDQAVNPLISIQVTGVDIEPIIRDAESVDNPGNRRRKIRELLLAELGVVDESALFTLHPYSWRHTRREVEVVYENVREMSDERLRGREYGWTIVVDIPFDDGRFTPMDDLARLARYRGTPTRTLVWLPSFLSERALRDLGRLVVLDHLLAGAGERFAEHASHLAAVDRGPALALARNQRDQLRQRMLQYLLAAYGVADDSAEGIAERLEPQDQFRSLDTTLKPRPPVGASLKDAFESLLDQLFTHQYPGHPRFDVEIRPVVLKRVWQEIELALTDAGGRSLVAEKSARQTVRSVVNPLKLGTMGENHLVLEPHWRSHFLQMQARDGVPITVGHLRGWMNEPQPMGLPPEVENLVILTFAGQTNRTFWMNGGPAVATLESMPDAMELREQSLPPRAEWDEALRRAGVLFGLALPQTLNATHVARAVAALRAKGVELKDPAARLAATLAQRLAEWGQDPEAAPRLRTARSAAALTQALVSASDRDLVSAFAAAAIATGEAALGTALTKAAVLEDTLRNAAFDVLETASRLMDHRAAAAARLHTRVAELLAADEHAIGLAAALGSARSDALKLLADPTPKAPAGPVASPTAVPDSPLQGPAPAVAPWPTPAAPEAWVLQDAAVDLDPAAARALLDRLGRELADDPGARLTVNWRIVRRSR
jgi:hypothetical protein